MLRAVRFLGLAGLVAAFSAACGAAQRPGGSASAAPSSGERLWRSKCGGCHVPVRPGLHERAYLELALSRHRSRVHMSEPAWSSVIDFLATHPADVASTR